MASAEKTGMVGTSFYISPGQLHTSLDADTCNDSSLHQRSTDLPAESHIHLDMPPVLSLSSLDPKYLCQVSTSLSGQLLLRPDETF